MHFESDLVYNLPNPQAHFHIVDTGLRYDSSHPSNHFPIRQHHDTPSPIDSQLFQSRSGNSPGAVVGVVGPTRTSRTRRTGSFGSTSPPPHFTARPQAIVIPRSSNSHSHSHSHTNASSSVGLSMSPLSPMSSTSPISTSATSASSTNHGHGHVGWYNMPTSPDFSLSESLQSSGGGGGYNAELYLRPVSALQHHSHSPPKLDHFVSYANNNNVNIGAGRINGIGGVSGINGINGISGLSSFNASPVPPSLTPPSLALGCGYGLNGVKTKKNGLKNGSLAGSATTTTTGALTTQDKQALIAAEKRRKRRESHNAVERRRRDNINERISELATLIPECMLEVSEDGGSGAPREASASAGSPQDASLSAKENSDAGLSGGVMKTNKGMILYKSVEYIRYLQQLVSVQGARNRQLEAELKAYKTAAGVEGQSTRSSSFSPSSPSGSSACLISASISTSISSPAADVEERSEDCTDHIGAQQHQYQQQSQRSPPCNMIVNGHNGHDGQFSSSNGVGSFGSLFGEFPSMPEEEDSSAEYHDADMCSVVDGESSKNNEKSERGMGVQCHDMPAPEKIKEELDLILMEA